MDLIIIFMCRGWNVEQIVEADQVNDKKMIKSGFDILVP